MVELVNEAVRRGLLNPDAFSIADLQRAIVQQGHKIAPSTLSRIFVSLVGVFFSKLETLPSEVKLPSSFEKKSGKGRKPDLYRILPLLEIKPHILAWAAPRIYEKHHPTDSHPILARPQAAMMEALGLDEAAAPATAEELHQAQADAYHAQKNKEQRAQKRARLEYLDLQHNLDDTHSTPLPEGWPLNSARLYRAAFLRATHDADPDLPRKRKDICVLLGIANGSIGDVVKRAGLEPIPQYEPLPIKSATALVQQVNEYAYEVKGYAKLIESYLPNGQMKRILYDKDTATQFVANELTQKAEVYIRFQLANKYHVVRSTPPPTGKFSYSHENNREKGSGMYTHTSKAKGVEKKIVGPYFNVQWVFEQLKLAIILGKSDQYEWWGEDLVDRITGEIHEATPLMLLEILLGRPLNHKSEPEGDDKSETKE